MEFPLKIVLLFFSLQLLSQSHTDFHKAEECIITNKLDSATYFLNKLENTSDTSFLKRLIKKENLTYADYYQFTANLAKRENVDYLEISKYINREVKEPINPKKIDVDYFNIKWILITKLRNEAYLKMASSEQYKLEKYVAQFNKRDEKFLWANTKLKTHPIVMYLIEKDIKQGEKLNLECLKVAKDLQDVELQIIFSHYLTGFLVEKGKLDEYIDLCEKSLELEKKLLQKSLFYYSTINNLIDAYIYKGSRNKRVMKLIDELYNSYSRIHSYTLYAQLISKVDDTSVLKNDILKKFDVKDVLELTNKFENLGKELNSNDFYKLLNMCSKALATYQFYDEALVYKQKAVVLTRKIYSEDLSESLANYKTEQAIKVKEKEIDSEKEKTRLYLIIALLCFVLLIITFFILRKLRKQSIELTQKNILVKKSLQEKELLITEMHHRVKNNFQLITSLLELETNEIKDQRIHQLLEKGKNRIKSMSLIHQKLYSNKTDLIQFDEFINSLIKELSFLYKYDNDLKVTLNIKEISFDVDTAIPLALILNEIITNSFKYAFKNQQKNKLFISLKKASKENYELIIKDNGLGLEENFNIKEAKSSGLKLVERLVKQLQGNLTITNESGAKFRILFKDTKTRKETI